MEIQYYIQYILSWVYHNILYTEATFAIVRILFIIGLVSLLVYRQYMLFVLLCILVLCAEYVTDDGDNHIAKFVEAAKAAATSPPRVVDKDELTTGISIDGREGFSIGMPKIIKGDDSGKDHRRSNKFIEEDSREFSETYFNTKRCSIGSGIGGITMFGSNELIGTSREATISGVYDFAKNATNNTSTDADTNTQRFKYFKECVFEPVKRSTNNGTTDLRTFKKKIYTDVTSNIINIENCLSRFNTAILFTTSSDINGDYSQQLTTLTDTTIIGKNADGTPASFKYTSLIAGGDNKETKLSNIQPLNKGNKGDNFDERTYSALLKATNESNDVIYTNHPGLKQRAIDIFGKVYGYRTRISEVLEMMRAQTKNDAALLHTVRINESIVKELRTILAYLAMIQRTDAVIKFEESIDFGNNVKGIYNRLNSTPPLSSLGILPTNAGIKNISGDNNIFRIPLDDDTYNTSDEKRYVYGITYYYDTATSQKPYS
jgi:hypothetical protein